MHFGSAWRWRFSHAVNHHAVNDVFGLTEDQAQAERLTTGILSLDVLANDRASHAARLYSIDDGGGWRFDWALLAKDVGPDGASPWETTDNGNLIRISHSQIELDLGHSLSALGATDFNSMAAGDVIDDDFVYAIRWGYGRLSEAHVHVHIDGVNDAATISGTSIGTVAEDSAMQTAHGALTVTDPDHGQSQFQVPASLAGTYGTFAFEPTTGVWGYTLDNGAANVQALTANDVRHDQLTVSSADGTAYQVIDVTIHGADEPRHLDIVAGAEFTDIVADPGSLAVVLHDETGEFQAPALYHNGTSYYNATLEYTTAIGIADLNDDGLSDIVTTGLAGLGTNSSASVGVLLGQGGGTFGSGSAYHDGTSWGPNHEYTLALDIADFNGDGVPDIATAGVSGDPSVGSLGVLLGNGDGTFQDGKPYSTGTVYATRSQITYALASGDFNGDGKLDIVTVGAAGSSTADNSTDSVSMLLGNGDGSFGKATIYSTGNIVVEHEMTDAVAVGDVNGDGRLDVVTGGFDDNNLAPGKSPHSMSVLLGNGDGTLQTAISLSSGIPLNSISYQSEETTDLILADLNGDGKLDIVGATHDVNSSVFTILGNGDGTFQPQSNWSNGASPNGDQTTISIAVGDINGDGRLDIAALDNGGSAGVLYGNGNGNFQSAQIVQTGIHDALAIQLGYLVSA
ncbi:FG-GAP-like repeat-containing protein [Bradyrhizobium sp. I71]|uniref:FG-GAP-like repeat-containing protein n=1 Tax=Bradyrhizobium sp. I71 TaxID=2590772 RepID=UPI001EF952C1|nr:FG-GAP-like repeat-containing protein [Bradyrhizobium sp. I71]ULK99045.1 VCBS repeat-containing protein [Bradyrhizobium sp. I71]